jgi:hypothetical protein
MRLSSKHSLFWLGVWICCSCSVLLPAAVSGQRAVASLGKRLQKRFGGSKRGSTGNDEAYILEGETNFIQFYYYRRWTSALSSSPVLTAAGTTVLAMIVGLLLFIIRTNKGKPTTDITEDGE